MKFDLNILKDYCAKTTMCYEKHPTQDLYLFGYYSDHISPLPTVWDEISIHCRGIILDGEGRIIERPFPKFWTYRQYLSKDTLLLSEDRIIKVPREKFRILEKVDGTMVTLYWIGNKPYLATQRSFTNIKAIEATKLLYAKYSHLFSKFDKQYTYVFEAVYPETKVLIDYGDTRELFLIGMIDKVTGKLMELPDIGFPLCRDFSSEYGYITNFDELIALNLPNQEGFVIYFESGLMIKVKFPWYQDAHKILDFFLHKDKVSYARFMSMAKTLNYNFRKVTQDDIGNALQNGDINLYSLRYMVPDFYYLMGYDYWLEHMKSKYLVSSNTPGNSIEHAHKTFSTTDFDIEKRMKEPHIYETSVWKWEERYIKH